MMTKTTFYSKVRRISDTNIGTVSTVQLKDRLKEGQSPMAKKIYKSRIIHVAAFPPTLPCQELVMECTSWFDIVTKSIIFYEGKRALANINGEVIEEVFNIPQHRGMTVVTMDQTTKFFQGNQEAYFIHLKQN